MRRETWTKTFSSKKNEKKNGGQNPHPKKKEKANKEKHNKSELLSI
jgi:hypothetical protein